MIDPQLLATMGFHPAKRNSYSIATMGFGFFEQLIRYGIKLKSYITQRIEELSLIK